MDSQYSSEEMCIIINVSIVILYLAIVFIALTSLPLTV